MGLCRRIGAMNAYHWPHALGSVLVVVLRAIPKVSEGVPLDELRVRLTRPAPLRSGLGQIPSDSCRLMKRTTAIPAASPRAIARVPVNALPKLALNATDAA